MKNQLIILIGLLLFISCSKKDEKNNGRTINTPIQKEIQINGSDTLKINLGSFGDEEGAWIYKYPRNAKVSKIFRQINSGLVLYEYLPSDNFIGKDSVVLIFNRGSNGASAGINDTTGICIIVK